MFVLSDSLSQHLLPLPELEDLAVQVQRAGVAPQVAVGFASLHEGRWVYAGAGALSTFFDLASLTKPMTALAVAAGALGRRDRIGVWVPEVAHGPAGLATVEALLSHRAGLPAHRPFYEVVRDGGNFDRQAALRDASLRRPDPRHLRPVEGEELFEAVYSDLGYILVGEALARRWRTVDAGEVLDQFVVQPLGLASTLGSAAQLRHRGIDLVSQAAPTEDVPWRGGVLRGVVHDENAWALSGEGASGHAGMFGTLEAVLRFGTTILDLAGHRAAPLGPGVDISWLVEPRPGGTLRAGFDGKSLEGSSAGVVLGSESFGHLGFTGTSLWMDPMAQIVVVFLSNRVNPTRANTKIREFRPIVHDALAHLAQGIRRA